MLVQWVSRWCPSYDVDFCLYGSFNCILFHKLSWLPSVFSLCSSRFVSALLVLSTTYLLMKVSLALIKSLVVDWAQNTNQLTTTLTPYWLVQRGLSSLSCGQQSLNSTLGVFIDRQQAFKRPGRAPVVHLVRFAWEHWRTVPCGWTALLLFFCSSFQNNNSSQTNASNNTADCAEALNWQINLDWHVLCTSL